MNRRSAVSEKPDRSAAGELSYRELAWRGAWIGIRLVLVYIMLDRFQPFFYQAF